MYNNRKMWLPH